MSRESSFPSQGDRGDSSSSEDEEEDEDDTDTTQKDSASQSCTKQTSAPTHLCDIKDEKVESKVTTGDSNMIELVKTSWEHMPIIHGYRKGRLSKSQLAREMDFVLEQIFKLEFFTMGENLVRHLHDRVKIIQRAAGAGMLEVSLPATWTMDNPTEIFRAVESLQQTGYTIQIHRAFAEICLWRAVGARADQKSANGIAKNNKSVHISILEKLGGEAAGDISQKEVESTRRQFINAYHAGQRWANIAEAFGGLGTILIFIAAGKTMQQARSALPSNTDCDSRDKPTQHRQGAHKPSIRMHEGYRQTHA